MKIFPPGEVWGRSAPSVYLGLTHISETIGARRLRFYTLLDKSKYSFRCDNISAKGRVGGGAALPSVNLGSLISKTIRARKFKFYTPLERDNSTFRKWILFRQGTWVGRTAPSVNVGPPHISETIRARKLKFYTHLDAAKYSFSSTKNFR